MAAVPVHGGWTRRWESDKATGAERSGAGRRERGWAILKPEAVPVLFCAVDVAAIVTVFLAKFLSDLSRGVHTRPAHTTSPYLVHLKAVSPHMRRPKCSLYLLYIYIYSESPHLNSPSILSPKKYTVFEKIQHDAQTNGLRINPTIIHIQPVIRAIGVSHTAGKDELRQNIRPHSWSVF